MRRSILLIPFLTLVLSPFTSSSSAAQDLSDADKAAIRAVWAEFDAAAMADDFDRFMAVFADQVVEIFQDHRTNIGKENMRVRVGSWFRNGHFPNCESRVEAVEGHGPAAVAWVSNTQTYINDSTGSETVFTHHFPAIMAKTEDGAWKILAYQFVPVEG
jgi:uncharacterized protein (TIGR02246 family)